MNIYSHVISSSLDNSYSYPMLVAERRDIWLLLLELTQPDYGRDESRLHYSATAATLQLLTLRSSIIID
jgi:hypothetical protein